MQPIHDLCRLSVRFERKGRSIPRTAKRGNVEIIDMPVLCAGCQQLCLAPALFGERIVLVIGFAVADENKTHKKLLCYPHRAVSIGMTCFFRDTTPGRKQV